MVGALPPPFIGPSIAMQRLSQAENIREAFEVLLVDISDRRTPGNIGKFDLVNVYLAIKHICQYFMTLVLRRPALVYLGISQGLWGYLRDLGFIIPALLLRRKVVVHLRGSEFGTFYAAMPGPCRWLTRSIFTRVSRVIVLGQNLKQVFKGLVNDDRLAVVPNGIDYQQFGSVARAATANIQGRVLYLSSLMKRKGTLRVIEALPDIIARHPEARMTFTGQWWNEDDRYQAMKFIRTKGLTKYVTFTGELSGAEKIQLYKQHDIFVFTPIEPEGLPWVILEAMSAGMPVVTSDQGVISEVVQNDVTGYVIEPEPQKIAEKICFLLNNPQKAKTMGLKGRQRVELYFSETAYLKALERVFQEALDN